MEFSIYKNIKSIYIKTEVCPHAIAILKVWGWALQLKHLNVKNQNVEPDLVE